MHQTTEGGALLSKCSPPSGIITQGRGYGAGQVQFIWLSSIKEWLRKTIITNFFWVNNFLAGNNFVWTKVFPRNFFSVTKFGRQNLF